ncbi:MAG: methylmalonyl-CoA epimerase [Ktedonobacterales bacterium]
MSTLEIKRIDHVAIVVANLKTALHFYQDVLGITPTQVQDFPSEGVKMAFLPLGGSQGSQIELLEPVNSDTGIARFLQKHGEGMHHICLEVEDIDRALLELQASGVAVLDTEARPTAEGRGIFLHPRSTNGVLLELIQRSP